MTVWREIVIVNNTVPNTSTRIRTSTTDHGKICSDLQMTKTGDRWIVTMLNHKKRLYRSKVDTKIYPISTIDKWQWWYIAENFADPRMKNIVNLNQRTKTKTSTKGSTMTVTYSRSDAWLPSVRSHLQISAGSLQAGWPGRYIDVWRCEGLLMVLLQLKDPLELLVKGDGIGFLSRCDMT